MSQPKPISDHAQSGWFRCMQAQARSRELQRRQRMSVLASHINQLIEILRAVRLTPADEKLASRKVSLLIQLLLEYRDKILAHGADGDLRNWNLYNLHWRHTDNTWYTVSQLIPRIVNIVKRWPITVASNNKALEILDILMTRDHRDLNTIIPMADLIFPPFINAPVVAPLFVQARHIALRGRPPHTLHALALIDGPSAELLKRRVNWCSVNLYPFYQLDRLERFVQVAKEYRKFAPRDKCFRFLLAKVLLHWPRDDPSERLASLRLEIWTLSELVSVAYPNTLSLRTYPERYILMAALDYKLDLIRLAKKHKKPYNGQEVECIEADFHAYVLSYYLYPCDHDSHHDDSEAYRLYLASQRILIYLYKETWRSASLATGETHFLRITKLHLLHVLRLIDDRKVKVQPYTEAYLQLRDLTFRPSPFVFARPYNQNHPYGLPQRLAHAPRAPPTPRRMGPVSEPGGRPAVEPNGRQYTGAPSAQRTREQEQQH